MMVTDLNLEMQNIHRPYMKDIIRLQEIEKTVTEIEVLLFNEGISMVDKDGVSVAEVTDYNFDNIPRKNQNIETLESAVFEDYKVLKEQVNILVALEQQSQKNRNGAEVIRANSHFLDSGVDFTQNGIGCSQAQDVELDGSMNGLN